MRQVLMVGGPAHGNVHLDDHDYPAIMAADPADPADNRWPEAIRWGTRRENNLDRHRDGGMAHAKLTPEIVVACRARRANGETWAHIAADYAVSSSTVRAAVVGQNWSWV